MIGSSVAVAAEFVSEPQLAGSRARLWAWEARLEDLAEETPRLSSTEIARWMSLDQDVVLRRYTFTGPAAGNEMLRLAVFSGIHGDEPEGVEATIEFIHLLADMPALGSGFEISFYPLCNPTGLAAGTRENDRGKDLNRLFWRNRQDPEVTALERELSQGRFHGLIQLHSDNTVDGFYAFARGALFSAELARPALRAAADYLPVSNRDSIDGFPAVEGIIQDCYPGVLSNPKHVKPMPFELILESPQRAPRLLQRLANLSALLAVLERYRVFMSQGQNI